MTVYGERVFLQKGQDWQKVSLRIPPMPGGLIDEAGFCLWTPDEKVKKGYQLVVLADDLCFDGLFVDLAVQSRIESASEQLELTCRKVEDILRRLREM